VAARRIPPEVKILAMETSSMPVLARLQGSSAVNSAVDVVVVGRPKELTPYHGKREDRKTGRAGVSTFPLRAAIGGMENAQPWRCSKEIREGSRKVIDIPTASGSQAFIDR